MEEQVEGRGTALTKQPSMSISRLSTHLKHQILQISSLCRRPMDTRRLAPTWNPSHIKHKIPHLSEKHIRRSPIQILCVVRITIYEAETRKIGCSFEDWGVVWVPD